MRWPFPTLKIGFRLLAGFFVCLWLFASTSFADSLYLDKIHLVTQQIDLLQKRLIQADQEVEYLRHQRGKGFISFENDEANRSLLSKTALHYGSSKSDLDSINIELTDSQQAQVWLEKNIQEIQNQLNALTIFGLKLIHGDVTQSQNWSEELKDLENLNQLEKRRASLLLALQKQETAILDLYNEQYAQINTFLKSKKMLRIKEQQVKSELEFQKQQNHWLKRLDGLYEKMDQLDVKPSQGEYSRLERDIFDANENINRVYLNTLVARYQDQLRQIHLSLSHTNSLSLLNSFSDQAQVLGQQIARVEKLINQRLNLIHKRRALELHEKQGASLPRPELKPELKPLVLITPETSTDSFSELEKGYENLRVRTMHLNKHLGEFRALLDRSIQHELSARQGLPGFSAYAWLDLGKEALSLPTLSFQLLKGFTFSLFTGFADLGWGFGLLLVFLESISIFAYSYARKKCLLTLMKTPGQDGLALNPRQLLSRLLLRNLLPICLIVNAWVLFYCLSIPASQSEWLINLAWVWLVFRMILSTAKTALLETLPAANDGHDTLFYHRLRILLLVGALISGVTVFVHQLPLLYEIKDLFDRLLLLMLLVLSLLTLRFWRVLPRLILQYAEPERVYLRRIILFLGIFIPSLIFLNSLIGLFGFVNLVGMISWYEGLFTLVFVIYSVLRAFLSDFMEYLSQLMIRHFNNGWLWTEAFLKPLHKVLRLLLFIGAWMFLFLLYGWNQQSPVVERMNKLFAYPLIEVLNTKITFMNIFEVLLAIAIFHWAARWTREFVYRLLLSKTRDLGIRNSIAILSQYAVVIIGVLICLRLVGIDLHALFLVASGLLIALSFGLRDLVNNFACGLMLLFERPIRVGDIVCVNGQEGKVTQIGSRAVTVRTWDHMDVIVPNTELFNKSFINWTVHDDIVRTVIIVKIDRQDNPYAVQTLIHSVLKEQKDVLKDPEPEVFLKDMIDQHSEFEIRYCVNLRHVISRVSVRSVVLFALWRAFDQEGIKAPNLQHEILIKGQPLLPAPQG